MRDIDNISDIAHASTDVEASDRSRCLRPSAAGLSGHRLRLLSCYRTGGAFRDAEHFVTVGSGQFGLFLTPLSRPYRENSGRGDSAIGAAES